MARYYGAAVCRRGHKISAVIDATEPIPERCSECGAKVLQACPHCGAPIKGLRIYTDAIILGPPWEPSDFCDRCGSPYPWASREAIAYHVENLLDEQPDLADGDRRNLEEQLKALREAPSDAATEKRQLAALKLFQKLAPKAWEIALPALQAVLSAEMKRAAGLPPTL